MLLDKPLKLCSFLRGDLPRLTGLKIAQRQRPDCDSYQSESRMTDCGRHFSDLPVPSFRESEFQPRSRNGFSKSNRDDAGWNSRHDIEKFHLRRQGFLSLNKNAPTKLCQRVFSGDALDLDEVCSWMPVTRFQKQMFEQSVIGEEEKSFTIGIEPSDRVNAFREWSEVCQCFPARGFGELAEHGVRFMEKDISAL